MFPPEYIVHPNLLKELFPHAEQCYSSEIHATTWHNLCGNPHALPLVEFFLRTRPSETIRFLDWNELAKKSTSRHLFRAYSPEIQPPCPCEQMERESPATMMASLLTLGMYHSSPMNSCVFNRERDQAHEEVARHIAPYMSDILMRMTNDHNPMFIIDNSLMLAQLCHHASNPHAKQLLLQHWSELFPYHVETLMRKCSDESILQKLMTEHPNVVSYACIAQNPHLFHLIPEIRDKSPLTWGHLSKNPGAIVLLQENLDKVIWSEVAGNPRLGEIGFKLDYSAMRKKCAPFAEELSSYVCRPHVMRKCLSMRDEIHNRLKNNKKEVNKRYYEKRKQLLGIPDKVAMSEEERKEKRRLANQKYREKKKQLDAPETADEQPEEPMSDKDKKKKYNHTYYLRKTT